MRKRVELLHAFAWLCEECGSENFIRAAAVEMTDDAREAAYRHYNRLDQWAELPNNWREFSVVDFPTIVNCVACKSEFGTDAPTGLN